jgi:hypothetical protein
MRGARRSIAVDETVAESSAVLDEARGHRSAEETHSRTLCAASRGRGELHPR